MQAIDMGEQKDGAAFSCQVLVGRYQVDRHCEPIHVRHQHVVLVARRHRQPSHKVNANAKSDKGAVALKHSSEIIAQTGERA